MRLYKIRASEGRPSYDDLIHDDEVRCTSYFSKLNPVDNGEVGYFVNIVENSKFEFGIVVQVLKTV